MIAKILYSTNLWGFGRLSRNVMLAPLLALRNKEPAKSTEFAD
jgi:hypothetical protein